LEDMNYNKGFAAVTAIMIVLGVIVLGGAGYVAMNPQVLRAPTGDSTQEDDGVQTEPGDHAEVDHEANEGMSTNAQSSIVWSFESMGEIQGTPYTTVTVVIDGTAHEVGKFVGSCSEVGASGGIDATGLLAGELSAAQCWFAGSGDEIGVFAHEDGGFEIMVGELSEREEGAGMFRGNFSIKNTIRF
jgi:hypothetical protein